MSYWPYYISRGLNLDRILDCVTDVSRRLVLLTPTSYSLNDEKAFALRQLTLLTFFVTQVVTSFISVVSPPLSGGVTQYWLAQLTWSHLVWSPVGEHFRDSCTVHVGEACSRIAPHDFRIELPAGERSPIEGRYLYSTASELFVSYKIIFKSSHLTHIFWVFRHRHSFRLLTGFFYITLVSKRLQLHFRRLQRRWPTPRRLGKAGWLLKVHRKRSSCHRALDASIVS